MTHHRPTALQNEDLLKNGSRKQLRRGGQLFRGKPGADPRTPPLPDNLPTRNVVLSLSWRLFSNDKVEQAVSDTRFEMMSSRAENERSCITGRLYRDAAL